VPIPSSDPSVCALSLMTECGPVLFVCVYMPVDSGDAECAENYIATCAYITALCEDCDATQYVIAGDFDCDSGSQFYTFFRILLQIIICVCLTVTCCLMWQRITMTLVLLAHG